MGRMSDRETLAKQDCEHLLTQAQFRRFLFRLIQTAGIFSPTTNGSDGRNLDHFEGRRHLGLEILAEVAGAQPVADPEGYLTLLQVLREEAQQTPEEPKRAKSRYDRTDELADDEPGE